MSTCVYMIQSVPKRGGKATLYTGITNNVPRRLIQHLDGKGAKYLRGRKIEVLRVLAWYPNRSNALREEARVKRLTKQNKSILFAAASC